MNLLAAAVVDVSAVLLVALAANAVLRRQSAALRHWILTVAILSALAAPALELTLPTWTLPVPASQWATPIVAPGTLAVFESIVAHGPSVPPRALRATRRTGHAEPRGHCPGRGRRRLLRARRPRGSGWS